MSEDGYDGGEDYEADNAPVFLAVLANLVSAVAYTLDGSLGHFLSPVPDDSSAHSLLPAWKDSTALHSMPLAWMDWQALHSMLPASDGSEASHFLLPAQKDWQVRSYNGGEIQPHWESYRFVVFPVPSEHLAYMPVRFPAAHQLTGLLNIEETRAYCFYARLRFQ